MPDWAVWTMQKKKKIENKINLSISIFTVYHSKDALF